MHLRRFILAFSLLIISLTAAKSQILNDTSALNLIKKGIDHIYNFEPEKAESIISKLSEKFGESPVIHIMKGLNIYWKHYPLLEASPQRFEYEKEMRRCIELSESMVNKNDEKEMVLTNLCASGMLLLFCTDNDMTREVVPLALSTYPKIRKSFDYISSWSDFQYFTGLYNYYRVAYPDVYPVYKPVAALFPAGDKNAGVMQLNNAGNKAIVLQAEAWSLLYWVTMNYDNNYSESMVYIKKLTEKYPENLYYRALYIKNLLLLKEYGIVEELIIKNPVKSENKYYLAQTDIFSGIVYEKKYLNYSQAAQLYNKGISGLAQFLPYGSEYSGYAYMGLYRINALKNPEKPDKELRRKALNYIDFKSVNFD